jgi:(1->4)-alpha-D-glucan 1-alpha-D-glucosylmutase
VHLARGDAPGRLLVIRYHDRAFPVRPEAEGAILAAAARAAGDEVLGVAARVLARSEAPGVPADDRDADLEVAERTALTRLADPATSQALDLELAQINADPDRLDLVLARQHHRLARWTIGDAELDYRRFFDVDELVATRADAPATFDLLHRLPLDLLRSDVVDGLRVDHVDGLTDPTAYLAQLRAAAGDDAWLVVEKIVRRDEQLLPWPVEGTTGYEVVDLLGGWLSDERGAGVLHRGWVEHTKEDRSYRDVALAARREVLTAGFAADLGRVVDAVQAVCLERRRHRDHARADLRAAIVELAVLAPTYRTYVPPTGVERIGEADRTQIADMVAGARRQAPHLDPELLELLGDILTGRYAGATESQVVARFQQLTGPVAAKGEEDTALYRWLPLPHRCEVGADPSTFCTTADEWHAACVEAQAHWPQRLTTLSTHDTKRSADARARLAALTTVPEATLAAVDGWWAVTTPHRTEAIDPATGWLVFHALVAGWPMDDERAWAIVQKSVREAGVRTSWTNPDQRFEAQLRRLVEAATTEEALRSPVAELVEQTAALADAGALAQLLAQLLAPGVPDVYQGGEGWDHTLVDPDNRRPPDPSRRTKLVDAAGTVAAVDAWADPSLRALGLPRTIVLRAALSARRRHPDAVGVGATAAYAPLEASGPDATRVLAFARGAPATLAVVVARPGPGGPAQADVVLPDGTWTDLFTGATACGRVEVTKVLDPFPIALLER